MLKVELSAAEEQCKTLKEDIESSGISKDELVKKAWEARDAAVHRKNNAEIGKGNKNVFSNHQIALRSIFKNLVKWQQDF